MTSISLLSLSPHIFPSFPPLRHVYLCACLCARERVNAYTCLSPACLFACAWTNATPFFFEYNLSLSLSIFLSVNLTEYSSTLLFHKRIYLSPTVWNIPNCVRKPRIDRNTNIPSVQKYYVEKKGASVAL